MAPHHEDDVHLRFVDVHKRFGVQDVLRGVSLNVLRGSVHFVLGPSGVGKSVLVKHVVGLLSPDAGQIALDGEDITDASGAARRRVRARCQLVLQSPTLFDQFNILDNVALPLRGPSGAMPVDAPERALEALTRVGAAAWAERMPFTLSMAAHKRVAVARALVMQPACILYDEPTTGLDPEAARATDDLIADTARTLGVTSLIVSHDMVSVRRIAQRVSFLHDGVIALTAGREAFLASKEAEVAQFVNPSAVYP